jgi:hypothetical protein
VSQLELDWSVSGVHLGYTGTQHGMTALQKEAVVHVLGDFDPSRTFVHHGDCIGGDEQFHAIAQGLGFPAIVHPPDSDRKRAFCPGALLVHPPYPYLVRNRHIVRACAHLLAAPKGLTEELRSGTWATVRYARAKARAIIYLFPDGRIRRPR